MQRTFVDKEGEKIVSSLTFYWVELPSRKLGVIEEVLTVEGYRRQGRATKLINEALEYARELGLDCVELTVRQDSPHSQKLYKDIGFYDRLNHAYRHDL